jgi:hypothetical protein
MPGKFIDYIRYVPYKMSLSKASGMLDMRPTPLGILM